MRIPLPKLCFSVFTVLATAIAMSQEPISVNLNGPSKPTNPMPLFSVGSDRAAIFLRESHQRDLLALQKDIGFKYLRCHGIFNEEMKVVRRRVDGSLAFDWTNVDAFIDRLKAAGLRPFVEFGYMPEPLASGKETVFYYRGNSTPPKSQAEWAELIDAFMRHQIERFGIDEVRQWFFEVWNEPNLDYFWRGTQAQYFEMYKTTALTLKKIDKRLKVGGPATAGVGWITEFLDFCAKEKVPVDFVATHHYGATQGFVDADGKGQTILDTSKDAFYPAMQSTREKISKSAFPKLPLYITEWGPSYSQVDFVHDNYICAAWVLEKLRKSEPYVQGMSYWAFSDQFEEGGPVRTPFHGGFGMLNYDGLRKPAFFAYQFLAKLAKRTVSTSFERLYVTKDGDNVTMLTWDYTEPNLTEPNNPFFHKDQPAKELSDRVFELSGLKPGRYTLARTVVGYQKNDVYNAYTKLGKPEGDGPSLPVDVINKLRDATKGEPEISTIVEVGKSGVLLVKVPMRTNDCVLLELKPAKK